MLLVSLATAALTSTACWAGSASLTWQPPVSNTDGSPLTNLASYRVSWGCSSPGIYPNSVAVNDPSATGYTVNGLPDAGTCYFAVKAVNSLGTESVFSNEASKTFGTLPGKPSLAVTWAGGNVAIAFVASTGAVGTGKPNNPVTTGSVDTTGAQLLIVTVGSYPNNGGAGATEVVSVSDSKGNTWTRAGTVSTIAGSDQTQIWYSVPTTVGSSHTFTVDLEGSTYTTICAAAYNGFTGTPTLDQVGGSTGTGTTLSSGNVTTSVADELLIGSGTHVNAAPAFTGSNSFTVRASYAVSDDNATGFISDRVVSATGTYAATATTTNSAAWAARIATFYDNGGGGGGGTYNAVPLLQYYQSLKRGGIFH